MISRLLLLAVMVAHLSASPFRSSSDDEPEFCHDLDCPKYTLMGKRNGYEIRKYSPSKWVGTVITSDDWYSAVNEAFDELFKYISGANRNSTKIPMASPVATKVVPLKDGRNSNFTILFFTPFAYKIGTPVPTNPNLQIVDIPEVTAYVNSFSGFERDHQLQEYTEQLEKDLQRDNMQYVKDFFFTAGYDPPYKLIGRHNEVWLIAT